MNDNNLSIKIPDQFYCGFKSRREDECLGFMTPYDETKAFESRKQTVDSWRDKNIETKTIKNELLSGFRIDRHIKRYGWNGGNVVVRVEDPRGWECEISVANLCKIIENNTIENGIILAECIWGRDGGRNILLAKNSQPYIDATVNTKRQGKIVPVKDVNIGDYVLLKNGTKGIYFGRFFTVDLLGEKNSREFAITVSKKSKHILYITDQEFLGWRKEPFIQISSSLQVSEILNSDQEFDQGQIQDIFDDLKNRGDYLAFASSSKERFVFDLKPISKQNFDAGRFHSYRIITKNRTTGDYFLFNSWNTLNNHLPFGAELIELKSDSFFVKDIFTIRREASERYRYHYSNTRTVFIEKGATVFDKFDLFDVYVKKAEE
jgi:hypothetical protein